MRKLIEKFKDIPVEVIGVFAFLGTLVYLFTDHTTLMLFCIATFLLICCRRDK